MATVYHIPDRKNNSQPQSRLKILQFLLTKLQKNGNLIDNNE